MVRENVGKIQQVAYRKFLSERVRNYLKPDDLPGKAEDSEGIKERRETRALYIDLQAKAVAHIADILRRGVSIYFIFVGICIGYLHQLKSSDPGIMVAKTAAIFITVVVGFLLVMGMIIIIKGTARALGTLERYDPEVFAQERMVGAIGKIQTYTAIGTALCILILCAIADFIALNF